MNKEAQEIALRYKGEDYKQSVERLQREGFINQGFNEWRSPVTGCIYRMMIAHDGGYISRVECIGEEGPQLINTEFYDSSLAIKRFEDEHGNPKHLTMNKKKEGIINALFKYSPNQLIRDLQRLSKARDPFVLDLYQSVGIKEGDKIPFKKYLLVNDGSEHSVIAIYSTHKRYDREELRIMHTSRKNLYIYRALKLPEDMIESLLSRASLLELIGENGLLELESFEEC